VLSKGGNVNPASDVLATLVVASTSMSELSPAAQTVLDAYYCEKPLVGSKRVAAALRAAADLLSAEVDAPKVDGSKYNGLWHSHDLLTAIADELEAQ
jgi:hypothetical protein